MVLLFRLIEPFIDFGLAVCRVVESYQEWKREQEREDERGRKKKKRRMK